MIRSFTLSNASASGNCLGPDGPLQLSGGPLPRRKPGIAPPSVEVRFLLELIDRRALAGVDVQGEDYYSLTCIQENLLR
jgi:hypothetical protein